MPEFTLYISSHFFIQETSESLAESLAEPDCDEKDKKAIVASIAKMTITTISSTRVKAFCFELIIKYL